MIPTTNTLPTTSQTVLMCCFATVKGVGYGVGFVPAPAFFVSILLFSFVCVCVLCNVASAVDIIDHVSMCNCFCSASF